MNSTRARTKRERYEGLDGYRAIMALGIVVYHAYQYSGAAQGLPSYVYAGTPLHEILVGMLPMSGWFFTLSGFLLFLPFAQDIVGQRQLCSPRGFLVRRAIRLLPAYYIVLIAVWTWRYVGNADQRQDLLMHLTFTHVFHPTYIFWTLGPTWSLADEMIYCLFLAALAPLAAWLCSLLRSRATRTAVLLALVIALGVASAAYKWWTFVIAGIPLYNWPTYYGPLARFDNLALGMLLAVVVAACDGRRMLGGAAAAFIRVAALTLFGVLVALRSTSDLFELYYHALLCVVFTLLLASTTLGPTGSRWERALDHPIMTYLGTISYSIYLWHEPIMIELGKRNLLIQQAPQAFPTNALWLLALSVVAGALGCWLLEQPLMELRHLFTPDGRLIARQLTNKQSKPTPQTTA